MIQESQEEVISSREFTDAFWHPEYEPFEMVRDDITEIVIHSNTKINKFKINDKFIYNAIEKTIGHVAGIKYIVYDKNHNTIRTVLYDDIKPYESIEYIIVNLNNIYNNTSKANVLNQYNHVDFKINNKLYTLSKVFYDNLYENYYYDNSNWFY